MGSDLNFTGLTNNKLADILSLAGMDLQGIVEGNFMPNDLDGLFVQVQSMFAHTPLPKHCVLVNAIKNHVK